MNQNLNITFRCEMNKLVANNSIQLSNNETVNGDYLIDAAINWTSYFDDPINLDLLLQESRVDFSVLVPYLVEKIGDPIAISISYVCIQHKIEEIRFLRAIQEKFPHFKKLVNNLVPDDVMV